MAELIQFVWDGNQLSASPWPGKKPRQLRIVPDGVIHLCLHQPCAIAPRLTKLNVSFILTDELGWAGLACAGRMFYEPPNLDQLAKQGMGFTDAYAAFDARQATCAAIRTGNPLIHPTSSDLSRPPC